MKSRSNLNVGLLGAVALTLWGCGGGGSSTPFSYAGTYSGTWNAPSQGTNGNLSVTVLANNTASGSMTGSQYPGTAVVTGSLPPSGQFSGTIQYDPSHTFAFQGPASFSTTESGHLVGTINQDWSLGVTIPIIFDLVKQ